MNGPNRNSRRRIAMDIKRMSPDKIYKTLEESCMNYGDTVTEAIKVVLHRDFGFGVTRINRLMTAVNEQLAKEE